MIFLSKQFLKSLLLVSLMLLVLVAIVACSRPADVVSKNLSKEADNFNVQRRVVFYNGITGDYILVIEGLCSLGNNDSPGKLSVTCRTSRDQYKKHFLGLSDNVTFFAEQVDSVNVNEYHYKVIFRPQAIIPDITVDVDGRKLEKAITGN